MRGGFVCVWCLLVGSWLLLCCCGVVNLLLMRLGCFSGLDLLLVNSVDLLVRLLACWGWVCMVI